MGKTHITLTQAAEILGIRIGALTAGLNKNLPKYRDFPTPELVGRRLLYDKALVLEFKRNYKKGYKAKYTERFYLFVTPEHKTAIKENGGASWLRQLIDNAINRGE